MNLPCGPLLKTKNSTDDFCLIEPSRQVYWTKQASLLKSSKIFYTENHLSQCYQSDFEFFVMGYTVLIVMHNAAVNRYTGKSLYQMSILTWLSCKLSSPPILSILISIELAILLTIITPVQIPISSNIVILTLWS